MAQFDMIICSVNLIEHSDDIVEYTKKLADKEKTKILVTHILPATDHLRAFVQSSSIVDSIIDSSKKNTAEYLSDFIAKNFAGYQAEPVVLEGVAADAIINLADERCADLIVMGSMSSKTFLNFISVKPSNTVIGRTRVPVLVIPNDLSLECMPAK